MKMAGRVPNGKHPWMRHVLLFCFGLLAAALFLNLIWASSSSRLSFYLSSADTPPSTHVVTVDKEKKSAARFEKLELNATYADLPAPELEWQEMAEAPVPRLDGSAKQIGNLLYVFSGYGTIDHVHSHVDIYNFSDNTWGGRFDTPKEMAHSHLGLASDGRYIYIISGQYGPQCRGPTSKSFVLDTETEEWGELPPLPVPRYLFVMHSLHKVHIE